MMLVKVASTVKELLRSSLVRATRSRVSICSQGIIYDCRVPDLNTGPESASRTRANLGEISSYLWQQVPRFNQPVCAYECSNETSTCLESELKRLRLYAKVGLPNLNSESNQNAYTYVSASLPCKILGGLSINAVQPLFGWRNFSGFMQTSNSGIMKYERDQVRELKMLNANLFEENEELNDLVRDLTIFIERQKDTIENLKHGYQQ
mmetsp:Transcript_14348/g.17719  ORF Transcript_14348/g.17719 Transcript_14348/m.17719 type:complete len:207 (+) Transcript_14348:134-754(+)